MHQSLEPAPPVISRPISADTAFVASLCAASMGAIWDMATGHAAAFDKLISNWLDNER